MVNLRKRVLPVRVGVNNLVDKQEIIITLKSLVSPLLEKENIELVDLNCFHQGKRLVARFLVDKPEGGITIDECAGLNKQLGELLDERNIFAEGYILEVFSPGLGRVLKTKKDFLRVRNNDIEITLQDPVLNKRGLTGCLTQVSDDKIKLDVDGELVEVSLSNILYARQKV